MVILVPARRILQANRRLSDDGPGGQKCEQQESFFTPIISPEQ